MSDNPLAALYFTVASNINIANFDGTVETNTATQSFESALFDLLKSSLQYLNKEAYAAALAIPGNLKENGTITTLSFLSDAKIAEGIGKNPEHFAGIIIAALSVENPELDKAKILKLVESLSDTLSAISSLESIKEIITALPENPTPQQSAEAWQKFADNIIGNPEILGKMEDLILSTLEVLEDNPGLLNSILERTMPDQDKLLTELKTILSAEDSPVRETTALELGPKKQEAKPGMLGWIASKMYQGQATVERKDLAALFERERAAHLNDTAGKVINTPLQARLWGKDLSLLTLDSMDFKGFNIAGFNFASSSIANTSFNGSFIKECYFAEVKFNEHVDFTNCVIDKASFMSMIPALKAAQEAGIKVSFSGTRIQGHLNTPEFLEQIEGLHLKFDEKGWVTSEEEVSRSAVARPTPTTVGTPAKPQDKAAVTIEDKEIEAAFGGAIKLMSDVAQHLKYDAQAKETKIGRALLNLCQKNPALKEKLEKFPVVAKIIQTRTVKQIVSIVFSVAVRNFTTTMMLARTGKKLKKAKITPELIKNKLAKAGVKGIREALKDKHRKSSRTPPRPSSPESPSATNQL